MIGATEGITVWTLAIDALEDGVWPSLEASLDAAERERAGRFVFPRHRRAYIAAHALKRRMLTVAEGGTIAPSAWTFVIGAHGKPRVSDDMPMGNICPVGSGLHFNISHCEGLVTCALSRRVEIGVDVESLDRPAPLEIAASYFARTEVALLNALPVHARARAFFRLWTLKEAWLKATGVGLSMGLQVFAFQFDPLRIVFDNPTLGDSASWRFEQWQVGSGHLLALAWGPSDPLAVEVRAIRPHVDEHAQVLKWAVADPDIRPLVDFG